MRYLLITLTLLLTLAGCQDTEQLDKEAQAKHDAKIAQQARAEVLAELQAEKIQKELAQAEEEKALPGYTSAPLNQMGIQMTKNSISIDTNKTKTFFNDLGKILNVQMQKISADLEKGIIDSKEAGIEINEKHIHIDLNKTQNMLEDWGAKIQVFVQEFDDITKDIENNDNK